MSCFWLNQPTTTIGPMASREAAESLAQKSPSGLEYEAINAASIGGLSATADTTLAINFSTATTDGYALSINGVAVQAATTEDLTGTQLATNINANASATGVTAAFAAGVMTLTAVDGRNMEVAQTATATEGFQAATASNNTINAVLTGAAGNATLTAVGSIRLTAADSIIVAGAGAADIGYTATSLALGNSALNSASVTTVANANTTIGRVDAALTSVSGLRSTLGAIQNRFESTISNLEAVSENLTASRSRILDADFAAETAALTRAQILQQAGVSILAQANTAPQSVLALLQ